MPRIKRWIVLCLVAGAPACEPPAGPSSSSSSSSGDSVDHSAEIAEACKHVDCDNVVNAVLVPLLIERGFSVEVEDTDVLCRRYAVDLTGMVPTPEENQSRCQGKSPAEMVDYFMNKPSNAIALDGSPPYVFVNRRGFWSGYGSQTLTHPAWEDYVRDLDIAVGQVFSGKISYDVFARKVLASPAFVKKYGYFEYTEYHLKDVAAQAIRVFLGREALPAEAANFGNLWRGWASHIIDAATAQKLYPKCPVSPYNDCFHYEVGIDWSQCKGSARTGCQSDVFGKGEYVPAEGLQHTDWKVYDPNSDYPAFVRYAELPASELAKMEVAGELISKQKEFPLAAADRALVKYLGWWRAGVYKPDFELAPARAALAEKFVKDGYDLRELEAELLGSLLYAQVTHRENVENAPLWAFGPLKPMGPELWLDLVAAAVGKDFGVLDFRYGAHVGEDNFGTLPGKVSNDNLPQAYVELGGGSGVRSLSGRRSTLWDNCPVQGIPMNATVDQMIDATFDGLGRPAKPDERSAIKEALQSGADGCPDLTSCQPDTASYLCRSILASSLFALY